MQRGYEIVPGEGATLSFSLSEELNEWLVKVSKKVSEISPGQSVSFRYVIRVLDRIPSEPGNTAILDTETLLEAPFRDVEAVVYKPAPVKSEGRVMLPQVIADLGRPKTRGITLGAKVPEVYDDMRVLRDWGCNLGITGIRRATQTWDLIELGHELGMEIFAAGQGQLLRARLELLLADALPK